MTQEEKQMLVRQYAGQIFAAIIIEHQLFSGEGASLSQGGRGWEMAEGAVDFAVTLAETVEHEEKEPGFTKWWEK